VICEIEHCKSSSQITENVLVLDEFYTSHQRSEDWCSQRSALPLAYDPVHGHVNKPCAAKPICYLGAHLTNSLKETLFGLIAKEPGELWDRGDR
jgi:hypothetical protein